MRNFTRFRNLRQRITESARRTQFHRDEVPGTRRELRLVVTATLVDASGKPVGSPVHVVHPASAPAVIEERGPVDGLRMVYNLKLQEV